MKKLFLLFLLLSNLFCFAQYTSIPDSNFEQILIDKRIDSGTIDGKVLTANISGLTNLDISSRSITNLTGIQDFLSLKDLDCSFNRLTNLDITKNTSLTKFYCKENQLINLDISKNTALTYLNCYDNKLISLDVTKNTLLTSLICGRNELVNLDVFKNILLTTLQCEINKLTSLDVTNNTSLTTLNCSSNYLTSLDVSNNIYLTKVECMINRITSLDFSKNSKLTYLGCMVNELTYLNLKNGNNTILTSVISAYNRLACIQVDNKAYSDTNWIGWKEPTTIFSENCSTTTQTSNVAPILTATGNQTYCASTNVNIVTSVSITDPDDTSTDAIYIQISSGYIKGQDLLTLSNSSGHPTIQSNWNPSEGKLTLKSPTGIPVSYIDFVDAIKEVQFSSSSATPSGVRNFSISIGQANFLPRNGHYYEYVPNLGISWTNAKVAADAKTYYGLKGYLATLADADEAQLAGAQAPGAGWIGGSDTETEGTWKWMTGPEAGTIFWQGKGNGSTPTYANWNSPNEPNDSNNNEDYAHITDPSVGKPGTWNDLPEQGDPPGNYHPKGYVVEYGGTPGDPILQLSASTTLTIAAISSTTPGSRCDAGTVILKATATAGTINWYDAAAGGNYKGSGSSFTTPNITTTNNFYVETATAGCTTTRTAVEAKTINTPTITNTNSPATNCGPRAFTLKATPTEGNINWYSQIGGNIVGTGLVYTTPTISSNTTYYAEASNNGCVNSTKTPVSLIVYPFPIVSNQTREKCVLQTITLDAVVPNMTYLWSTGAITQSIDVIDKGIYTVDVTSLAPENCTSKKTITVLENNKPEIKNVSVNETTVTIELVKNEDYFEFSIDGINYQSSNVFTNAPSGLQTAYVREINLCSIDQKTFIVIIVPKFFTPNNDGHNDIWEVKGLINYPLGEVAVFDRYGKLITYLNRSNHSWDGTFNKNPLPASDYWYVLKLDPNSPELKGHFSLKR
nr:T9SS type B sorting domain-containing protein [uncultured Flavobacterium sp.]